MGVCVWNKMRDREVSEEGRQIRERKEREIKDK